MSELIILQELTLEFVGHMEKLTVATASALEDRVSSLRKIRESINFVSLNMESEISVGAYKNPVVAPRFDEMALQEDYVKSDSYLVYVFSIFDSFLHNLFKITYLLNPPKFDPSEGAINIQDLFTKSKSVLIDDLIEAKIRKLNNRNIIERVNALIRHIDQKNSRPLLDKNEEDFIKTASISRNFITHNRYEIKIYLNENGKLCIDRHHGKNVNGLAITLACSSLFSALGFRIFLLCCEKILRTRLEKDTRDKFVEAERLFSKKFKENQYILDKL